MNSARRLDTLVIHCAATPNGRWHTVQDIDHWHRQAGFSRRPATAEARAWNPELTAIGYHWVIHTNGALATGRHVSEVGAHARGFNAASLSVCLIGTDRYTTLQWMQLEAQVRHLCTRHGIPLRLAEAGNRWRGVCGHRDTGANKSCPGFSVGDWLAGDMQPPAAHWLEESA